MQMKEMYEASLDKLVPHFTSAKCKPDCPCFLTKNDLDEIKPEVGCIRSPLENLPTEMLYEMVKLFDVPSRCEIFGLSKTFFALTRQYGDVRVYHLKKSRQGDDQTQYAIPLLFDLIV
jgi:hypothetical protein